ncbi:pimeloyl-ACP methyl ester esterase BioH [Buchnera aphidicola]|uniref:pimeloyl-ACP methyl ester esterase BioH n=1 Tax=Buchnera aphidicola TaxID=9 RepID=UPI0034646D22
MKNFSWKITGTGKINLILLHGWGINSKIWYYIVQELKIFFKIHLIDFPGFGKNKNLHPLHIDDIINLLHTYMPKNAIWIGWSIGGLIASQYALKYPMNILGIITVSSSPCFLSKKNWPGIKKNFLDILCKNLITNYYKTINNFLSYNTIHTLQSTQEINILKNILLSQPKPSLNTIKYGLNTLCTSDLCLQIRYIKKPFLRIYGNLDVLVPIKIAYILNNQCLYSSSIIINNASHLPFISHKKIFCLYLLKFVKKITD